MAMLAAPTSNQSHVTDTLELARMILSRHRDNDLAQKIMVLQGYLELSRTNPDRSYDEPIRQAFHKLLRALVNFHPKAKPAGTVFRQAATWRG